jgi:protein-tyrosine kinase
MKFLRAEEGDEPTPAAIRPFMQAVSARKASTNGHKHGPTGKAIARAAEAHAAPALPVPTEALPANTALPAPVPIQAASPAGPVPAPAAPQPTIRTKAPAHVAPAPALAPAKPSTKTPAHAAPPKQPRVPGNEQPTTPRIRPEMLDACVVALRRMGGAQLRSVGVTSSVRGEGRSTVAAAMAVIHASEYGRTTILVEFDGHRSPAAREFGLAESPGIAELVRDNLVIDECIQWITDDFGVVVAGSDPSMANLLHGSVAEDLVEALSSRADMVVLDLPPLAKGAGGVQLVDLCEAVALVVRAGVSTHRIEEAAAALTTPPFVILNGVKSAAPRWVRRLLGMG